MSTKSGSKDLVWIFTGALGLLIAFILAVAIRGDRDPSAHIVFKETCVATLNSMRLSLAAASEAQNGVVMSTSEQDSKAFAEEAHLATAALERGQKELEELLKASNSPHKIELMERVAQSFREFRQIDQELLDLGTQSSNRKAFSLAFGPAMTLLKEIDDPLSHLVADDMDLPADSRLKVSQLACDARVGVLRMQVLLLPHIAEASDQKMDEFEQQMSAIDQKVKDDFGALQGLLPEAHKPLVEAATKQYTEFENLKAQIIALSRQNTDVRAVAIALKEKRKAMLACQDALVALESAIQSEPVATSIPAGRAP